MPLDWADELRRLSKFARRAIEALLAAAALLLLSPVFAVIALAIELDDGGPIFFRHARVGRGFREFRLLKFRSMKAGARGAPITGSADPRITRVGRFLRRCKLDELPQLVNVLKGDLQFVGPRPEVAPYVQAFRAQYEVLLRGRPGITDPATLAFHHEDLVLGSDGTEEQYTTQVLPRKLELSLDYARRRTLGSDLRLVGETLSVLLSRNRTAGRRSRSLPDARTE